MIQPIPKLKFLSPKAVNPSLPLFIFLPGMDGTGHLLEPQVEALATRFDVRCLSIPANDQTDWDGLADQVIELIAREQHQTATLTADRVYGAARPIYICGESFGGCLGLKIVAKATDWCDRLILINPASSFSRLLWLRWSHLFVQQVSDGFYQLSAFGLLPFLIAPDRVLHRHRQALLQASQSVTAASAAWRLNLLREFSLHNLPLGQITQPTLVIASQKDRILPSCSEANTLLQVLPQAKKVVLPESGHACLLETDISLYEILQQQQFLPQATPNSSQHPALLSASEAES